MKNLFAFFLLISCVGSTIAQINNNVLSRAPKQSQLPVPTITNLKPDLTVEIEEVTYAKKTVGTHNATVSVRVTIRNRSEAASRATTLFPSVYKHSVTNVDHVFWHAGAMYPVPAIPALGRVTKQYIFNITDVHAQAYPFKVTINNSRATEEADYTNNDTEEIEITIL